MNRQGSVKNTGAKNAKRKIFKREGSEVIEGIEEFLGLPRRESCDYELASQLDLEEQICQ